MWLKICGGALLCAVAIVLLKSVGGLTLPLQWTGNVLLVGAAVLMMTPVFTYLGELCTDVGMGEMASLLIRGLGIALLTQLCADLCRQSGEASLAGGVELAGKAELLLLCLPLLKELIVIAQELLSSGSFL
jgi:stage III sporulation protein AD